MLKRFRNISGRKHAYVIYVMACILFFLWALFPSEDFADFLESVAARNGDGITVEIEKASPTLTLGLLLEGVVVTKQPVMSVEAASIKIRPGYFSLFGKKPSVSFSAEIFKGKANGTIRFDRTSKNGISVEKMLLEKIDLSLLKDQVQGFMPGVGLKGILGAEGGYSPEGRGNGNLKLDIKGLEITPSDPFFTIEKLTFTSLTALLNIKSRKLEIENCNIEGNETGGSMKGSVLLREPFQRSSLRLNGALKPEKAFLEKLEKTMPVEMILGGNMNEYGEIPFTISGTIDSPGYSLKR